MEQEGGIQEEVPETDAEENIRELNGTFWEQVTELEERDRDGIVEKTETPQDEATDGIFQQEISVEMGRDPEFVMGVAGGARPKIKEQVQGAQEAVLEQAAETLTRNPEPIIAGQNVFKGWTSGTQKKILIQVGRSWEEITEQVGRTHGRLTDQDSEGQEAGLKLVRDLLSVVSSSDLPHEEKLELEFVTLQFMMGGNVHLLGELQSQAVVEEFRQEVFANFPIPAFHVTSSVICCDQASSQRPERPQPAHENGCLRQQERIYSQLIFFLCRAPFLKSWDQLDRLAEMLHKLKTCIYYTPVALVGVVVQMDPDPSLDPEQEARARRWLRCLLDGFFCSDLLVDQDGTEPEVQVQVAVYQSGQPERALEVKRAACQAIRAALKF
ncbi:uncharacterized protein LOC132573406 [Heteronotia binoei]|uniref:uncharacterized protein LOC132573406 n=1 Tax=Heteronotia binoei TaxID=13085 RepID=UPI00292F650D|nr:uncharacterized protein LOC132573406 [Heteronotia binoei]